jgi:hypothetical protein
MKTFYKVLIALNCMATQVGAQAPVNDPYSIGVVLGGHGNCPVFISGVTPDSPAEHASILGAKLPGAGIIPKPCPRKGRKWEQRMQPGISRGTRSQKWPITVG